MGGASRFLMLLTTTPSPLLYHRCPSLLRLARHRHRFPSSLFSFPHHHKYHHLSPSSPHTLKLKSSHQHLHTQNASAHCSSTSLPPPPPGVSHPWPEWSNLIHNLSASGYFYKQGFSNETDELVSVSNLPEDFLRATSACLAFARERPDVLGMLSRRDIEVVVENGTPFLFKNGDDSVRRMRLFLGNGDSNVLNTDRAHMVDLMRFLLSYANNVASFEENNLHNRELAESSVRNLLSELAQLSYNAPESNLSGSVQNHFPDRYGQTPRSLGQNIEMKRGDWICPRCSFMNFARNVKCLECDEVRPKRQLTGGEWECPQCDFFNYGRNMACLRCDCKRPGEVSLGTPNSRSDLRYGSGSYANKVDVDSRLAANEEKAQRWFSKVSQLDSTSDMNSAIADEDFPEIMPLRKGVNRFVVSTRKTPLERRLANAQYQRNLRNDDTFEGNKTHNQTINRSLDEILGRKSVTSESDNKIVSTGQDAGTNAPSSVSNSDLPQYGAPKVSNSNYVPFVPLPTDMFAKKPDNSKTDESEVGTENCKSLASSTGEQTGAVSESSVNAKSADSWQPFQKPLDQSLSNDKEKEQAEKSERWFKRVAELHNVTDLASAIPDEDFPEIMPMRKGENRFVVSKKKDRSLTSPMYKRQMAMEQANNTNFVPFVSFPPNYFAKKDTEQPDGECSPGKATGGSSNSATSEKLPEKLYDARPEVLDASHGQGAENQQYNTGTWNSKPSGKNSSEITTGAAYNAPANGNSNQNIFDRQPSSRDNWSSGYSRNENISGTGNLMGKSPQNFTNPQTGSQNRESSGYSQKESTNETANLMGTTPQSSENQNIRDSWTGKSLEGSAVKEPDPLDMSEEAKAERWFRRVAQIKDISELSQIPDEDFPSIMPMRKGVNRFVVSKRKTPLERRLTSTQYRRNLPTVSSDPVKESDNS